MTLDNKVRVVGIAHHCYDNFRNERLASWHLTCWAEILWNNPSQSSSRIRLDSTRTNNGEGRRSFFLLLRPIHQPRHIVKRRPTTTLALTNNNLTCQCQYPSAGQRAQWWGMRPHLICEQRTALIISAPLKLHPINWKKLMLRASSHEQSHITLTQIYNTQPNSTSNRVLRLEEA